MKDRLIRFTTDNLRTAINKLEYRLPGNKKYKYFYRYINFCLKNDFNRVDRNFDFTANKQNDEVIPYKFWVMWWQGLNDVQTPLIIKKNIKRLQKLFGKENVVIITKDNFENYTNISSNIIKKLKDGKISFTNWSDIVRFNLLRENGGYWIDSTVVISQVFLQFLHKNEKNTFFSLCNLHKDYRNISYSQWTGWLMGGKPHYSLFEYASNFYDVYFDHHDYIIDYFLIDDIIAHYYLKDNKFKNACSTTKKDWQPYYWITNYDNKYTTEMSLKINNIEYSVQKLTYKFNKNAYDNEHNLLSYIMKNL
ncbi:glycosyl transferase [Lactobacillus acidophilus]|uniref:capsular polysaccharide synthesis protein n=1 Tax=Lactobacillus acidophilus TaxID=1579 RepID=UPI0021A2D241|nr:capsular polysaccharide synthesis protein [Lactobacillus acidophilus]MCT3602860.1 glycosyl transferase [Lactobacillus acidophilus]MCT3623320.1 glycosyl transferase [Lactobacillus acidophilus]